jgi:hypothetical protein
MIKNHHSSLWRWICARILALAIGSVIVIATCMWLRYAVQNYWIMGRMPAAVQEFLRSARTRRPTRPASTNCRYLVGPELFHAVHRLSGLGHRGPAGAGHDPFIVVMGLKHAGRWRCSSAAFVMRQRMSPKGNLAVRQSSSRMRRLKWSALPLTLIP